MSNNLKNTFLRSYRIYKDVYKIQKFTWNCLTLNIPTILRYFDGFHVKDKIYIFFDNRKQKLMIIKYALTLFLHQKAFMRAFHTIFLTT